jgi:hypothetical protein
MVAQASACEFLTQKRAITYFWGQPLQSRLGSVFESFSRVTNGKRVLFGGYTLRVKYQFPYHVVQRSPDIRETVTNDEREIGWKFSDELLPNGIRGWIYLNDQVASFTFELPMRLLDESIIVLFGPEDFEYH